MSGRIFTFYSWKGGVGRTMALANVGVQLARRGKRVLLVIDDIWRSDDFRAFDVVSAQSRVLFTTRDAGVLRLIGAREEALEQLDELEAKRLIAESVGTSFHPAFRSRITTEAAERRVLAEAAEGLLSFAEKRRPNWYPDPNEGA